MHSLLHRDHEPQNIVNDSGIRLTIIDVDKEYNVIEFLAQMDSLRLLIDQIRELTKEIKEIHKRKLEPLADPSINIKNYEKKRISKNEFFFVGLGEKLDHEIAVIKRLASDIAPKLKAGRFVTEGEIEGMLESENPAVWTQGIMVETAQVKQSLTDIQARHGDIMKLEKSIREIHDMFIDMAAMVQTQGEMIDRIEYNAAQSENFVESACIDTRKAVKFQRTARRKKILLILCLIITVVIILFILVIYFVVTKKNSSNNSVATITAAPIGPG
ncbi:unnamed protein product [Rotaria sp. Silwood1]|nr:unnamed protein product [Rotaria sp. Silwood1]